MTREEKIIRISGQHRSLEEVAEEARDVLIGAGIEIPESEEPWLLQELMIYAQMCRDGWVGLYDEMSDEDIDWLYSMVTDERFAQVRSLALRGQERNLSLLQTFVDGAQKRFEVREGWNERQLS